VYLDLGGLGSTRLRFESYISDVDGLLSLTEQGRQTSSGNEASVAMGLLRGEREHRIDVKLKIG